MTKLNKSLALLSIKYMPTILALTCSIKIMLLVMSETKKDAYLYAVNWINVMTLLVVLGATYVLGRCFGYCWKHRSLCRVALIGYVYYIFFLLSPIDKVALIPITILYVMTTIILTLCYKEIK